MSTTLLDNLNTEINLINDSGNTNLSSLLDESQDFINELKSVESSLEEKLKEEKANDKHTTSQKSSFDEVESLTSNWYKKSISNLKSYNSQVNKFQKNILNNNKYNVDLDDSYPFPLNLNDFPMKEETKGQISATKGRNSNTLNLIKSENHTELLKAIILHLLKIGQSDVVKDIVQDMFEKDDVVIEEGLFRKFKLLNEIVDDIVIRHDLTKVLQWFETKFNEHVDLSSGISQISNVIPESNYDEIEIKFHVLQFILYLNGDKDDPSLEIDNALAAYIYSKDNFPRFFKDYHHAILPLMSLLLFKANKSDSDDEFTKKTMVDLLSDFNNRMKQTFEAYKEKKKGKSNESDYISEILSNFQNIHERQSLFVNLANEFISEYCKDMKLSLDSSLFQVVLAGFINLPNFHKYSTLQKKMGKKSRSSMSLELPNVGVNGESITSESNNKFTKIANSIVEAPYNYDLPFLLPDSNRFLFKYHPIFICPVSKEQLIPLTASSLIRSDNDHKRKKINSTTYIDSLNVMHNPVVVLEHCQHVALRDSVWQLSRRGAENFKCHYCYKRHKISEVSDVYFIDL